MLKKLIIRSILILLISGILGTLFLVAAFSIPESAVKTNRERSLSLLKESEPGYKNWESVFTHGWNSFLDTNTDWLIITKTIADGDKNPLQNAVSRYPRYWNAGSGYLRVAFRFLSYAQIRFLLMIIMTLLTWGVVVLSEKHLGWEMSLAFAVSMISINYILIPFTMQVSNCFLIALGGILTILYMYGKQQRSFTWLYTFFFLIGIFVAYFDLLTIPVLSVGMPLSTVLLMNICKYDIADIKTNMKYTIILSFAWVTGYSCFWLEKWLITSVVMKENILADAVNEALMWSNNSHVEFNRFYSVFVNIRAMLPTSGENLIRILLFLAVFIILMLIILLIRKPDFHGFSRFLPLIFVGAYPFFWYLIVSGHSEKHAPILSWRLMMLPVFAASAIYAYYFRSTRR